MPPDAALLRRITGYGVGRIEVSRHAAFIDLGGIDAQLVARLQDGQMNLGQIFADPRIEKSLQDCGDESRAHDAVLAALAGRDRSVRRYYWRRYTAVLGGRAAFLVIELLDLAGIEEVLRAASRVRDLKR